MVPFDDTLMGLRLESRRTGTWLLSLGLAVFALWCVLGLVVELPSTVASVEGRVVSANESFRVNSRTDNVVTSLPFKLGDDVQEGELLVAFDGTQLQLQVDEHAAKIRNVTQEITVLAQEIDAHDDAASREVEGFTHALSAVQARTREVEALVDHAVKAEALYSELRSERRIDALEYSRAKAELEQQRRRLEALRAESLELELERKEIEKSRELEGLQLARERLTLEGDLSELKLAEQRLIDQLSQLTVRAPFAGTVGAIGPVAVGESLPMSSWVLTLVPTEEFEFQAFFLDTEIAGRLDVGTPARIEFHALPWTEHGVLNAQVTRVANESIDQRLQVDLSLDADAPLIQLVDHGLTGRVVVRLTESTLFDHFLRLLLVDEPVSRRADP